MLRLRLINTENFQSLSGETKNVVSNKLDGLKNPDERGPFKVDLRIILESVNSTNPALIKTYDIANCEVAKNGKASKSVTHNAKVLIEAKVILDNIVRVSGMKFDETKDLSVVNLQIAGKKTHES